MTGSNRKKTFIALYVTLISFIVLVVASYAWMTFASSPIVSNLAMSIVTENVLVLAPDVDGAPGEWGSILDVADLLGETDITLKPVTFSAAERRFYAPRYGLDGRTDFNNPIALFDLSDDARGSEATADAEGPRDTMLAFRFWMRTDSSDCVVYFKQAAQQNEGDLGAGTFVIGEPLWDADAILHRENGNGAQNAIRVAFCFGPNAVSDETTIVIYEPNADSSGAVVSTFSVDGNGSMLEGNNKLIRQSTSTFSEADPVVNDTVLYSPGEFLTEDYSLFALPAGIDQPVTMYVWLEGQDADCVNAISSGSIFANIQFQAKLSQLDPVSPD